MSGNAGSAILFFRLDHLDVEDNTCHHKGQFSFNTYGGSVWYDDLRMWEGVPDPASAKRKAEVIKSIRH